MTATNDGAKVGGSRKNGGVRHRGGQKQRTGASHHPKQQHPGDVFRIEHPPNDHRAEEHDGNPNRGEPLHKTLQTRGFFAEGVNGFDEAREAGFIACRCHFDLHRTALKHEASVEFVASLNVHGNGLASQGGHVEAPGTRHDASIGRDELSRTNLQFVTGPNQVDGDLFPLLDRGGWGLHRGHRGRSEAEAHRLDGAVGMRLVRATGGARQAVKTTLHGFPRPHHSVALQVLRERDEDDDDEGLFPHFQQDGPDDSHGREDLEANLTVAQPCGGLTKHLRSTDNDRQCCEPPKQKFRCVEHLHENDEGEEDEREGAAHQTALIRSEPVGVGQPKGGSRAKQIGQCCIPIGFQGFRCIRKQLEEHPVVPGHLGIKHARLPSKQAVQSGHRDAALGRKRSGRDALQLLVGHVGRVTKRAEDASGFRHGPHREVDLHANFASGGRHLRGPNLIQMLQGAGRLGRTIRAIHAQNGPGDFVLAGGLRHDFGLKNRAPNGHLSCRWRRFIHRLGRWLDRR